MRFLLKIVFFIIQSYLPLETQHLPITTLYCHGVCGDSNQINEYKDLIIDGKALNFPDTQKPRGLSMNRIIYSVCSKLGKYNINRNKMYMGHGQDVETIKEQVDQDHDYILFGLCRGGSAIVNYVAQYNPENVLALVLDEAPANMHEILDYRDFKKKMEKPKKKKNKNFVSNLAKQEKKFRFFFPAYPKKAVPPVDNIANIKNKNLVVFLSYTRQPSPFHFPQSTWKMYLGFKKAGFKNVYLCELESYGQNAQGDNKISYLQNLHSVYRKHNLPYKSEFAVLTKTQLKELQPTQEKVNEQLKSYS